MASHELETVLEIDGKEVPCVFTFEHTEAEKPYFNYITGHANDGDAGGIEIQTVTLYFDDKPVGFASTEYDHILEQEAAEYMQLQQQCAAEYRAEMAYENRL